MDSRVQGFKLIIVLLFFLILTGIAKISGFITKKIDPLHHTLLNKAIVLNVDEDLIVAKKHDSKFFINNQKDTRGHDHYFNIIEGTWITNAQTCINPYIYLCEDLEELDFNILDYLSEEELLKAKENKLTIEDAINILARIKELEEDQISLILKRK